MRVRWCNAETKVPPRESDGVVGYLCSSRGLTALVILNEGTVGHSRYIENVLLADLKYGNEVFGDKWIFQQDGANQRSASQSKTRLVTASSGSRVERRRLASPRLVASSICLKKDLSR